MLREISQTKTNTVWHCLYVESKNISNNVYVKQKQTHKYRKLVVIKEENGGRIN